MSWALRQIHRNQRRRNESMKRRATEPLGAERISAPFKRPAIIAWCPAHQVICFCFHRLFHLLFERRYLFSCWRQFSACNCAFGPAGEFLTNQNNYFTSGFLWQIFFKFSFQDPLRWKLMNSEARRIIIIFQKSDWQPASTKRLRPYFF